MEAEQRIVIRTDPRRRRAAGNGPLCDDILTSYGEATGADGPFNTVTIEGRTYTIFVTPYCS
jgi:hypothetical protein